MKKEETTNTRTLGKWVRRVSGIARDLDKSNDEEQRRKLGAVVADVAERLADAKGRESGVGTLLAPAVYLKRNEILSEADKTLNDFQPPPEGHPEDMKKAMLNDEREMRTILQELSQADEGLLEDANELLPISTENEIQETSLNGSESRGNARWLPRTQASRDEERALEQFQQKMVLYKQGKQAHSIMIGISEMGSETAAVKPLFIPLDHTFCALADNLIDFNGESFVPDFWSKEADPVHNCVTESSLWWEWQDPSKKVIDVINKQGHLGIETVCKEVEYIVVLVKKGESENGMPIDVPRTHPRRALLHLQQHFPDHVVAQVRWLQLGDDVKDMLFDCRYFRHQTNPLFVELRPALAQPHAAAAGALEVGTKKDKSNGRATDM